MAGVRVRDGYCICGVICASSENNAKNIIIISLCVHESFDYYRPYRIGAAVAICISIPSLTSIVPFGEKMSVA